MNLNEKQKSFTQLKVLWEEYSTITDLKKKETALKKFSDTVQIFQATDERLTSFDRNELSSISNLLCHEFLKVINHQCEILEDDFAFVNFLIQGTGYHLLLAIYSLADHVDNGNAEVSNLLVSLIPCVFSATCHMDDNDTVEILKKLAVLFKDLTSGQSVLPHLYETLIFSADKGLGVMSLFMLLLDVLCKLNNKSCALSMAECTVNIIEKLTSLLQVFSEPFDIADTVTLNEGIFECFWCRNAKLVAMFAVLCMLWSLLWGMKFCDILAGRTELSDFVEKLLKILANLQTNPWYGGGLREYENRGSILGFGIFLMYSILRFVLILMTSCLPRENVSNSDLKRKLNSKVQVFLNNKGCDFIKFVGASLNIVTKDGNMDFELESLLKKQAVYVLKGTGRLITSVKRAMAALRKSKTDRRSFSIFSYQPSQITSSGSLNQTVDSSTDEDWAQVEATVNIHCSLHSNLDCNVVQLALAILTVFKESLIEELEMVCLNIFARCGMCRCMNISSTSIFILHRLPERSPDVQNLALRLFGKIMLQDNLNAKGQSRRKIDSYSNSTDDVFLTNENYRSIDNWPCFDRLASIVTTSDVEIVLKTLKYLRSLSKIAIANLKHALFVKVFFPYLLTINEKKRTNSFKEICQNVAVSNLRNPYDSGYGTPSEFDSGRKVSRIVGADRDLASSEESIKICLNTILDLLEKERFRVEFMNPLAIECVVNFLGDPSLHQLCLEVLKMLAVTPNEETETADGKRSSTKTFYIKPEDNLIVIRLFLRAMFMLQPMLHTPDYVELNDFERKIRNTLSLPCVCRQVYQLWAACFHVLKQSVLFREGFLKYGGPASVVTILKLVKEFLYKAKTQSELKGHVLSCVKLMESAMAVGLEFAFELVDGVQLCLQINEHLRIIQRLIQKDKLLKEIAGKTFCQALLNLSIGAVGVDESTSKETKSTERIVFDFICAGDSESDNDAFQMVSTKQCAMMVAKDLEPGYDADTELEIGQSNSSNKGIGPCVVMKSRRMRDRPRQRNTVVQRFIIHPNLCEQLIQFIDEDIENIAKDRPLVLFILEGLSELASYSGRNRQILSEKGFLSLVLKTFTRCMTSKDARITVVQKTVLELIVTLAGHEIRCNDLTTLLNFLKIDNPSWGLLMKALNQITMLSIASHGPLNSFVFPARTMVFDEKKYKEIDLTTQRPAIASLKISKSKKFKTSQTIDLLCPPWKVNVFSLNVSQHIPWPVGSFSLAFWLKIDDGRCSENSHVKITRGSHKEEKNLLTDYLQDELDNIVHIASFGTSIAWFEVWFDFKKSSLICRWSYDDTVTDASISRDILPVQFPFKACDWTHVVISVQAGQEGDVNGGLMTFLIDGASETTKEYRYPTIPARKVDPPTLWIGQRSSGGDHTNISSGKRNLRPYLKLGNVALFIGELHRDEGGLTALISKLHNSSKHSDKRKTVELDEAAFLNLLGANCQALEFRLSEATSQDFNHHLDIKCLERLPECHAQFFVCGPHGQPVLVDEQRWNEIKASLRKQLLLVFSPSHPDNFLEYKLEDTSWTGNTSITDNCQTIDVIYSAQASVCHRQQFKETIEKIGGISVLLFLFAKTVEKSADEKAQADALSVFLTLGKGDVSHAKDLDSFLAYKMILKVLLTPRCMAGSHFVNVFMKAACDGEVLRETGVSDKPYFVNFNTTAVIKNFEILREFLLNWRIWYRKSDAPESWHMILHALETLTRFNHPYSAFNIRQFETADALGALLLGCQEIQAEKLAFSSLTTNLHLKIIQNLFGCPPNPQVLKRICEFLVAIHPTYETLVVHAPGNLYLSPIAILADDKELLPEEKEGGEVEGKKEEQDIERSRSETLLSAQSVDETTCIFSSRDKLTNVSEIDASNIMITVGHMPKISDESLENENVIETDNTHQDQLKLAGDVSSSKSMSSQATNSGDDFIVEENEFSVPPTMTTYRYLKRQRSELQEHSKLDELRSGLLELINCMLVNMTDIAIEGVLSDILKFEYFLCFVNYPLARVRAVSIQILCKMLERGSLNMLESFQQIQGFHLLAVQLHLYPITQDVAEACFRLFFQQPVYIKETHFIVAIKRGSEITRKINVLAGIPLLAMMEGSIDSPEIFKFLSQVLVKLIHTVENFLLKAADQGLLKILVNTARGLCVWRINNSDKSMSQTTAGAILDNLQYLIMAIVYGSLRMCGDRYYQIFDDLLLSLDSPEFNDKNQGLNQLLSCCLMFLRQCAIRFALDYIEFVKKSQKNNRRCLIPTLRRTVKNSNDNADAVRVSCNNYYLFWRTLDPQDFPVLWCISPYEPLPAEATPSEITSRFHDVCVKAVNMICYSDTITSLPYDLELRHADFKLPSHFEKYKPEDFCSLLRSSEIFTQWMFCLFVDFLDYALHRGSQHVTNKWQELIYHSKDKIRHLVLSSFSLEDMSTVCLLDVSFRELKIKVFALQFIKSQEGESMFLNILLGGITSKQKERTIAYVRSFLNEVREDCSREEKELRRTVAELLKNVEDQKMDGLDDDSLKRKEEEWTKQDISKKLQYKNKTDIEKKRVERELEQLCEGISRNALEVTKVSIDVQDKQRQNLLKHVKSALSNDVQSHKLWQMLVMQVTHERAIWYDKEFFPQSWQLDRTEGPCRVRCRLQRCHLDVNEKFIMPEHRKAQSVTVPLFYLFDEPLGEPTSKNVHHIFNTTDTIWKIMLFLHRCKSIMPSRKVPGEILIGEKRVYFVGEENDVNINTAQFFLDDEDITSVSWLFQQIREILRRRYALKDNALEIFLTNGRTFLLAFETTKDRETVYKELYAKELPNLVTTENVADLTQRWQNGELTNFAYLTELNKQACRSFNDLMQYPVFPLVLADYKCDVLDLTDASIYRDLSKPIAVQNPLRIPKYKETYRSLQEQYDITKRLDPMNCIPPYHYGSHYSNSGTVLHFLVRLLPFTKMFLIYQDKQFDVPDRTFHAIETTWNLSSFASAPDVKELIPEFFFLPEFLRNSEGFDFGVRQNGQRVMDVHLPTWACNDPRLFVFIHRQALESDIISSAINKWIDLVFGFKQEGQAAINAINVFHPSTYIGGIDANRLHDPLQRKAVQTMIETYGQTPAKLFSERHPEKKRQTVDQSSTISGTFTDFDSYSKSSVSERSSQRLVQDAPSPISTVYGIKWGQYVGSPAYPRPAICWSSKHPLPVARLVSHPQSSIIILPPNSTHLMVTRTRNRTMHIIWSAVLSWDYVDDIIRIWDAKKGSNVGFMENIDFHKVTCCAVSEQCNLLWIGSSTGCLNVWPTRYDRNSECGLVISGRKIRLQGHQASIICLEICSAFSIVVSGSEDGTAIIWDLNRLCYVCSLSEHPSPVSLVAISDTTGDIVTVCHKGNNRSSVLRLWSVNGREIKSTSCQEKVNCVTFSRAPEGVSVNSLVAGLENGVVRLWNTWTLDHIADLKDDSCQSPIVDITYSLTSLHLFTINTQGIVRAWGKIEKSSYRPRILSAMR
ncbi:lysosomal-trafficking regulator-like [Xenia sp. Carnegie-2017]|uniref:lysosomal-trafficking regulator-like n=1 Tax=Xenia sp. Carnegie-2017 TaxID=2897299 RepID=UPI001F044497|nr:lysosomal-trafficking regulator-like [Xenia sp. Carnegie-2017]